MSKRSLYESNPFSTRYVRPGAIQYLFPEGWSAACVIESLAANKWRGAIIGPHGSGKSTLLAALLPRLKEFGVRPHLISLHDGQRWLPRDWENSARTTAPAGRHIVAHGVSRGSQRQTSSQSHVGATYAAPTGLPQPSRGSNPMARAMGYDMPPLTGLKHLLIIDGYEQLNRLSRWFVGFRCQRRGWGLLATAHQPVPLPTIFETKPSLADFQAIVDRLKHPYVAILTPQDAAAAYDKANGNLREALFELYDRYQEAAHSTNRGLLSSVETA